MDPSYCEPHLSGCQRRLPVHRSESGISTVFGLDDGESRGALFRFLANPKSPVYCHSRFRISPCIPRDVKHFSRTVDPTRGIHILELAIVATRIGDGLLKRTPCFRAAGIMEALGALPQTE